MQDLQGLIDQATPTIAGHFAEIDGFEYYPEGGSSIQSRFAVGDWTTVNGASDLGSGTFNNFSATDLTGIDYAQFHKFGTLVIPMAQNGGTGIMQRYVDDVHQPASDLSWTSNGTFSVIEAGNYILMVDTGFNWPHQIDYVAFWQA